MNYGAALESDEKAEELARENTAGYTEEPDILYEKESVSADGVIYQPVEANNCVSLEEFPKIEMSSYTEVDKIAYDVDNDLALAEIPAEDHFVRIDRRHEGPDGIVYMMDTYIGNDSTTVTKNRDEEFVRIYGKKGSAVKDKNAVGDQIELFENIRDGIQKTLNNKYSLDVSDAGSSIFNVRNQVGDIFDNQEEWDKTAEEIMKNPLKNKGNRQRWRNWGMDEENHPLGYKEIGSGRDNRILYIRDDSSKKVALAAAGNHEELDSKGLWQPNNPTDIMSGLVNWSLKKDEAICLDNYEHALSTVGIDLN